MAAEPTTTSGGALLLAAMTAALGPLLAEWTIVLLAAGIGGFLAATAARTATLGEALIVFARGVAMSCAFSALAAALIAPYLHVASDFLLLPVAVLIGWHQDRLIGLLRSLVPSHRGNRDA